MTSELLKAITGVTTSVENLIAKHEAFERIYNRMTHSDKRRNRQAINRWIELNRPKKRIKGNKHRNPK